MFASCFLDAANVKLVHWGEGTYWQLWRSRFFANVLAELTLVPMIVTWTHVDFRRLWRVSLRTLAELAVLTIGLVGVSMQAMFHNAAFIAAGVPVFDIHDRFGATDMLVRDAEKGVALAETMGRKDIVLMRAHGSVARSPFAWSSCETAA